MTNFWQAVGSFLGSSAGFAIVTFLARDWIVTRLKASIDYEYAKDLSGINAKLDALTSKEKFVFEQHHLRYLEVLSELYGRMWYATAVISTYMGMGNGPEEFRTQVHDVNKAWLEFNNFLNQKSLWVPEEVVDRVAAIRDKLFHETFVPFQTFVVQRMWEVERNRAVGMGSSVVHDSEKWTELRLKMDAEIFPEVKDIGDDFRRRLEEELDSYGVTGVD